MSWVQLTDTRWHLPDDPDLHLLLLDPTAGTAGLFAELHGAWRHLYTVTGEVDPVEPLLTNTWPIGTVELPAAPASDEEGWQLLADAIAEHVENTQE